MLYVHSKFHLKAVPKMFFRSKRDKSDEASRNTCYVIEKYQSYVHFRFVDQGWQSNFDSLNIHGVLNIMLFYNVVFLYFFSRNHLSITVCSKASYLVKLREGWIWFVSKMAFSIFKQFQKGNLTARWLLKFSKRLFLCPFTCLSFLFQ